MNAHALSRREPPQSSRLIRFVNGNPLYFWLLVAAVFVLARIATWGYPYDSDHWIFYYVGNNWIVDGGQVYVDAWDHKPPFIFLFNGVMAALLGDNIVLHRIWLTALAILDTWLFYVLARRVVPPLLSPYRTKYDAEGATKIALLLYVFLRNLSQFTSSGNNTENYGLVFLLVMVLSYLNFVRSGKWAWLVLAGTSASVLLWLKGNFLIFGAVIGLLLLLHGWRRFGALVGHVVAFVAPILVVSGLVLGYFWSQGTFDEFVIAAFGFSAKYASSAWVGGVSSNFKLLIQSFLLLIPAVLFFIFYCLDIRKQYRSLPYQLVGLSFLGGVILIGAVGSFYAYYLLILMPFIVLVFTYGFMRLPAYPGLIRIPVILLFVLSMGANYAISLKQLANSLGGSVQQAATDYRQAAAFVQDNTDPDDKVFAYDYGATFYRLADRDSASHFISASVLLLDYRDGYGFGFDDMFIEEMEENQAAYVVLNDATRDLYFTNEPIVEYLEANFAPVARFGEVEVWERVSPAAVR